MHYAPCLHHQVRRQICHSLDLPLNRDSLLPGFSWTSGASWEEPIFLLLGVLLLVVNTNGLPLVLLLSTLWQFWEELSQVRLQGWRYFNSKENFMDLATNLLVLLLLFLPAVICSGDTFHEVLQHVSALLILIGWTKYVKIIKF